MEHRKAGRRRVKCNNINVRQLPPNDLIINNIINTYTITFAVPCNRKKRKRLMSWPNQKLFEINNPFVLTFRIIAISYDNFSDLIDRL